MRAFRKFRITTIAAILAGMVAAASAQAATEKPILYGKNWVAITG